MRTSNRVFTLLIVVSFAPGCGLRVNTLQTGPSTLTANQVAAPADPATAELILLSKSAAGTPGNSDAFETHVSGNGRYITYLTQASNILPAASAISYKVYRYDRYLGVTELVSAKADGTVGNGDADSLNISKNGRYVTFKTFSTDLDPSLATSPGREIAVKDMDTGAVAIASSGAGGAIGNMDGHHVPNLSADGAYAVFTSDGSTNLVPGATGMQIYRKRLSDGAIDVVTRDSAGTDGDGSAYFGMATPNGDKVIYCAGSTNQNVSNGYYQVLLKNFNDGSLIDVSKNDAGAMASMVNGQCTPMILADGVTAAISTNQTVVTAQGSNGRVQVYLSHSVTHVARRLSESAAGTRANRDIESFRVTPDGKFALFVTKATNLLPGAALAFGPSRAYRKDLTTGTVLLASATTAGVAATASVTSADISDDGKWVSFVIDQDLLAAGSTQPQTYLKFLPL